MSRSGDNNFASDRAFDYFSEIAGRLVREIDYWTLPERVYLGGSWLAKVLTVIEIMLLLEQNDIGHSVYLRYKTAVQRWRSIFIPVWDSEWKADTNYPIELDDYAYRQKHRPAIEAMFNRLESIAHFWEFDLTTSPELIPLLLDYALPYFSFHRTKLNDKKIVRVDPFVDDFINYLVKEIVYCLSPEKRGETISIDVAGEEVPAAAEILSLVGEKFKQDLGAGINEQAIHNWCDISLERIREFSDDESINWDTDNRLKIIKVTFDRLELVAQQYPPEEW